MNTNTDQNRADALAEYVDRLLESAPRTSTGQPVAMALRVAVRAEEISTMDFDQAARGYTEAHLWTAVDWDANEGDGEAMPDLEDNYTVDDMPPTALEHARETVEEFAQTWPFLCREYGERTRGNWSQFGHDLLLTRDGHGAGFWDRGHGALGDALSSAADTLGESRQLYRDELGQLQLDN